MQAEPPRLRYVTLHTGREVPWAAVRTTRVAVVLLLHQGHLPAAHELLEMCHNPDHVPSGDNAAVLEQVGLLDEGGRLQETVRDVVAAMFRGNGATLVNPLTGDPVQGPR